MECVTSKLRSVFLSIVTSVFIVGAGSASALTETSHSVGSVVVHGNGEVSFFVFDPVNAKSCTRSVVAGNVNGPKGAAMYNMLLNAKSYGWKITFDFNDCATVTQVHVL